MNHVGSAWTNNHLVNCRENEVKSSTLVEPSKQSPNYKERRFTRHKSTKLSILYITPFMTLLNNTVALYKHNAIYHCMTRSSGRCWERNITEVNRCTNAVLGHRFDFRGSQYHKMSRKVFLARPFLR